MEDTLILLLLSSIDCAKPKTGSVYIFTYRQAAFDGMVKIGYTGRKIELWLMEWATCGHRHPVLLKYWTGVQNPERVETLIHFELLAYWHAQRWCNHHGQPHIEWFKIDLAAASAVAGLWSQWMKRANPYDRRGHLKQFWKETIDFLIKYEVPITAKAMMEVQDLEDGSSRLFEFIDDDRLRKRRGPAVKQEQTGTLQVINFLPTLTELSLTPRAVSVVKHGLVKTEVTK